MRADRLLAIVLLLQRHGRMSAAALAERLEVSERTIYRDMEALGTSGIPVTAQRGPAGGWSLMGGYETRLTGLKPTEVEALFLPHSVKLLGDLGLSDAFQAALTKLVLALPPVSRRDAEDAARYVHVDEAGWFFRREDVPYLAPLQESIRRQCRVGLLYRRAGDGEASERLVDPLGLVAKGGIWYLVASTGAGMRTYRVSRVAGVRQTDEPYTRPPDFDLESYWAESCRRLKEGLPSYVATVRTTPEVLGDLGCMPYVRVLEESDLDREGCLVARVDFEVPEGALRSTLSYGALVEVLEPDELRDRLRDAATAVVKLYERGSPHPIPG